jgi:hypothetical protein
MSGIRAADLRLVLPRPPAHVIVDPSEPDWARAISELGLEAGPDERPDLAVGPLDPDAVAPMLLGSGRPPRRALLASGRAVERILVRPGPTGPRLAIPLGNPAAARLAFSAPRPNDHRLAAIRRTAARVATARGLAPRDAVVTVAVPEAGPPFPIAAAADLGADATGGWLAWFGDGDDIQRIVFHAIPAGATAPTTVVKVGRVVGYTAAFDADAAGLALLAARAPDAATHAPRVLGRFEIGGLAASVETAALGPTLNHVLDAEGDAALPHVDRVLTWLIALGRESRGAPGALRPELDRLAAEVLPAYPGVDPALDGPILGPLGSVPPVLAHRDVGSWNIAVDGAAFTVLDWESTAYPSVPLWDTAYLLADACSSVDGPAPVDRKVARIVSLFAGEHRLSGYAFDRIRTAAEALAVPDEAIGPAIITGWLHHGRSRASRAVRAGRLPVAEGLINRVAARWLEDGALGLGWRIPA